MFFPDYSGRRLLHSVAAACGSSTTAERPGEMKTPVLMKWQGHLLHFTAALPRQETKETCTQTLVNCARAVRWERSLYLMNRSVEKAFSAKSMKACSGVMAACGKATEWRKSLVLLNTCLSTLSSLRSVPDVILFNSAIAAMGEGHMWSFACEILAGMETFAATPDVVSFSSVLTACDRAARWKSALGLLEAVLARSAAVHGMHPDLLLLSSAISACEKGRQWRQALALLSRSFGLQIFPDAVCFDTVISACEQSLQWDRILSLFGQMSEIGATDAMSFVASTTVFGAARKWQHCLEQLSAMRRVRLRTSGYALCAALRSTTSAPYAHVQAMLLLRVSLVGKRSQAAGFLGLAEFVLLAGIFRSLLPRTAHDWILERKAIGPANMLVSKAGRTGHGLRTRMHGLGDVGQLACSDLLEQWSLQAKEEKRSDHAVQSGNLRALVSLSASTDQFLRGLPEILLLLVCVFWSRIFQLT